MPQVSRATTIKILTPEQMLKVRLESAWYARKHLSFQQVHRQIRKNGSVPSPNPFYTGRKTPEECYRLLNAMV
jgi:hypothetical protein